MTSILFVCVLYFAPLKTILCSIENRIRCPTKIHTELVLFFSLPLETFTTVVVVILYDNGLFVSKPTIIYFKYFLFTIVMATIPTTSKITASTDEENRTDSETDLSAKNTDDEIHAHTSNWSPADKKKLQHRTEYHQEYQHVFREGASIWTIMKRRISHMNHPMPKSICEEEMQSTHLDNSEGIIEYMTDAHGNKIKKLKPIFIKSKPDREYTQHIESDDDLPAVPEDNFTPRREVTVDSQQVYFFQ